MIISSGRSDHRVGDIVDPWPDHSAPRRLGLWNRFVIVLLDWLIEKLEPYAEK